MGSLVNDAGVTFFEGEIIGGGFTGWTTDSNDPADVNTPGGSLQTGRGGVNSDLPGDKLARLAPGTLVLDAILGGGGKIDARAVDGNIAVTGPPGGTNQVLTVIGSNFGSVIANGGVPLLSEAGPVLIAAARPVLDPGTATAADIANALIALGLAKTP